jgi:hypothetical protein
MKRLPNIIPPFVAGKRSTVLAAFPREWLDRRRRNSLQREIIEGCRAMRDVYRDMEQAYHPLEEEVAHALDVPSCSGLNSDLQAWYNPA